ncbi:hypothetical protein SUZIE_117740 [Sciurus carolinensis]|uniref:Secreted protein n=1 Tax=Sciurus carolinensis TaxID=30640 RepID=A0AA41SSS0_SCICA|nr:hypothetical protein [Sciurus carolinensis]
MRRRLRWRSALALAPALLAPHVHTLARLSRLASPRLPEKLRGRPAEFRRWQRIPRPPILVLCVPFTAQ